MQLTPALKGGDEVPLQQEVLDRIEAELPGIIRGLLGRATWIVKGKRWSRPGTMPEGQEAEDLLQEALKRLLDGTRKWNPEVVSLFKFLEEAMRSIADNAARSLANKVQALPEVYDARLSSLDDRSRGPQDPEDAMIQEQRCQKLVDKAFDLAGDDPTLEKVIDAMIDGCEKADEVIEATGLPARAVYNANRKLSRRVEAAAKRRAP